MDNNIQHKKQIARPTYPTLAQVRDSSKHSSIAKSAAVVAVIASMAMGAAACGEETGKYKGDNIGEKIASIRESQKCGYEISGEVSVDGVATAYTDHTTSGEVQIMGETTEETTEMELDGETEVFTEDITYEGDIQQAPTE